MSVVKSLLGSSTTFRNPRLTLHSKTDTSTQERQICTYQSNISVLCDADQCHDHITTLKFFTAIMPSSRYPLRSAGSKSKSAKKSTPIKKAPAKKPATESTTPAKTKTLAGVGKKTSTKKPSAKKASIKKTPKKTPKKTVKETTPARTCNGTEN